MRIGVLALQGDFELHQKALHKIGVESKLVKVPGDLEGCDGLILPGGESTTFLKLLQESHLKSSVVRFSESHQIFGTCAGLITLARKVENYPQETLGLIDVVVERNAYGRQIDSFVDTVTIELDHEKRNFEGVFIRAPKIKRVGEGVRVLGYHGSEIVLAENDRVLVATFHPELADDPLIHKYFVAKIQQRR